MIFEGWATIVTGAGSGIGKATAALFADEGAKVALVGRTREKLETTEREIRNRVDRSNPIVCADLEKEEECRRAHEEAMAGLETDRLDILVNNAGIYLPGELAKTQSEDWERTLRTNLTSVFHLTKSCLPSLARSGRGPVVINISSTLGQAPVPGVAAYCVSKAGLDMLTRCTALELAPRGIRVNGIAPAVVDTPIHGDLSPEARESWQKTMDGLHPLGRVGKAEEIAFAIRALASPDSSWITGVTLPVDGGLTAL